VGCAWRDLGFVLETRDPLDVTLVLACLGGALLHWKQAHRFNVISESRMVAMGMRVEREVPIREGRHFSGRIDLVVDGILAIEVDRVTPKKKSIRKVLLYPHGLVFCRENPGLLLKWNCI